MTDRDLVKRRGTQPAGLPDRLPNRTPDFVPPQRTGRLILWLAVLGAGFFGGMGMWAASASMQSAVVAPGLFRVLGDNLVLQHLEGGIVREIAVKEGQMVQEGDVIARLDDTRARASLHILQNQLAGALATEARLQAEFEEAEAIAVPQELRDLIAAEPGFGALLQTQQDVFAAGRLLDAGQVQILQDRISQLSEQAEGVRHRLNTLNGQLRLVQDELAAVKSLFEKGLATKPQYLALQRDEAALIGDIAVTQTNLQATQQQIAEIEARKLQVRRDRLGKITEAREAISETIFDIRQRIDAAEDTLRRLTIVAPRAGRVMGLQVNTLGAVLGDGERLAEIVPEDSPLVIEVRISPDDINQVHEGGRARVRLTAYNYRTTPMIGGWVTHVSPDIFTDQTTGMPYYKADVVLDQEEFAKVPNVQALAGMPAQVMIATGEQTLADYLLRPIIGGMEVALIEND